MRTGLVQQTIIIGLLVLVCIWAVGLPGRSVAPAMASLAGASGDAKQPVSSVVYVTAPSEEVAKQLATSIVEKKLAACVNIIPGITSVYFWDGKVNTDPELLLMIKTRESLIPDLTAHVKKQHPYDEPEVISVPITGGSASYLKWIHESTVGP